MDTLHVQLGVMGFLWIVSQILVRIEAKDEFSRVGYNSSWGYNAARGFLTLFAPLFLPYWTGKSVLCRLKKRFHKGRVKFLTRASKEGTLTDTQEKLLADSQVVVKTKLRTMKAKIHAIHPGPGPNQGAPICVPVWLLGAAPVAAIVCLTWIPGLHVELGVTEALSSASQNVGEWLLSIGK